MTKGMVFRGKKYTFAEWGDFIFPDKKKKIKKVKVEKVPQPKKPPRLQKPPKAPVVPKVKRICFRSPRKTYTYSASFIRHWRDIPVTEYVYNIMSREVCLNYSSLLEGDDEYVLVKTLSRCRWFAFDALQKNTGITENRLKDLIQKIRCED